MGVRLLIGEADGTTPAAALYCSTTGEMLGLIFDEEDPVEKAEGFLEWVRLLRFVGLAEQIGLTHHDLPDPRNDGSDVRHWPIRGLGKLTAYYLKHVWDPTTEEATA